MKDPFAVDLTVDEASTEETRPQAFNEEHTIHQLKHYLPAQASLKDFIHHNTLHAFQHLNFFRGILDASMILGYRVLHSMKEFRQLYTENKISKDILERIIVQKYGKENLDEWMHKMLEHKFHHPPLPRIGKLRNHWKSDFQIDLDSMVHPLLFRILCGYLDQGIAIWNFPVHQKDFISSIRELERVTFISFFRCTRAKKLLMETNCELNDLLKIVVGDESLYEHYIFDQQFAHQGWSGMVSVIESLPETLLDQRMISIKDLIRLELLLEIDSLDYLYKEIWRPIGIGLNKKPTPLFDPVAKYEKDEIFITWQEAFEWTYYDQVLAGIQTLKGHVKKIDKTSFQALFCIDDRECSLRRYLEKYDASCGTYGTPGFFSAEFFFQPMDGKFYTKVCPAPVTPKFLVKAVGSIEKRETELHFTKQTHTLFRGWLITQTLGFVAAVKLIWNIFRPTMSPATATSFRHMDKDASLSIENNNPNDLENGLQIGFAVSEMAQRVDGMLKSIGLVKDFAPIVYLIGHGSSSVNNPHYAAYDCGACSGRPGSVNSRVACYMSNHPEVRKMLVDKGIVIPDTTQFIGGLHDTTRDEVIFYDETSLSPANALEHKKNVITFNQALTENAKERSRRLVSIDSKKTSQEIHDEIKIRSVSLFEPRPELNHATNALCIVSRRSLTKGLFLDRRAFLNSYDYSIDPDGKLLFNIMKPLGPVCGGINLEYFFSRVDNQKLGAGTKLPHNVMGLFGVANGADGDLRPGLPSQMIEVHDPIRLMIIVEHFPEVVLDTIKRSPDIYEWFINDWVKLVAVNPENYETFLFGDGAFKPYQPISKIQEPIEDFTSMFENEMDNLPVMIIK